METRIAFTTAGIPITSPKKDTLSALKYIKHIGLDGMELEFVRGVRMSKEKAEKVGKLAKELDLRMSVHAPYWINLNSKERNKVERSYEYILQASRIGYRAGAYDIVFHSAYYHDDEPKNVHEKVKKALKEILNVLEKEGIHVILRPETMGKPSQYGTLEELVELSMELENVLPCIDIAHLHARTKGKFNTYEELAQVFEYLSRKLGRSSLRKIHIHYSGIVYGDKGERFHVDLSDERSDMNVRDFVKVLKDYEIEGTVVSETPFMEEGALILKEMYLGNEEVGFGKDGKIHRYGRCESIIRNVSMKGIELGFYDENLLCNRCF